MLLLLTRHISPKPLNMSLELELGPMLPTLEDLRVHAVAVTL